LCPGFVQTRIHESHRNKPVRYGAGGTQVGVGTTREETAAMVLAGIPTEPVGARVVEAGKDNDLYIFTHPEFRPAVQARFDRILEGFDKAERSKALADLPKRELTSLIQQQQK